MRARLVVTLLVLGAWTVVIVARLYQLQVRDYEIYRQRAEGQQQRRVELHPPRGTIYDARGREMALSVEVDSVWADPSQIENPAETARALARAAGLDARRLEPALSSDREFVWVARQLDPPLADKVRALGLAGVDFLKESRRYYPMRELAAQVLGFAGTDNSGLEGLEQAYDRVVGGRPVERKVVRDARRGTVLLPTISFREADPGSDLHLTIDSWIQLTLERELAAAVDRTRAKGATGVVLDPRSGAILAMATMPSFDPNHWSDFPRARWRNRAVADAFEPGSIFKMVTAAAALEANLLDPGDRLDCEQGSIVVDGVRIHDHKPFGDLTFREVIARSSNVGAIKTGLLVGKSRLYHQIVEFGFGRPTEIDLPGESPGILRPPDRWHRRATAYLSFGQGLSVTPLQMASAFAAIANGGLLYRPYVVAEIVGGADQSVLRTRPRMVGRAVSPATARSLERLLESVVVEGTGKQAAIAGYRVAGKTGTAQKASARGGYAAGRYVASFVGFAPARRPEVVAMIAVDEPNPARGYHGGEVAAPVFSAVVGATLVYLGVAPDREAPMQWPGERLAGPETAVAASLSLPGPSAVADTSPSPIDRADRPAAASVPDFSGLTARQAVIRSARLGLRTRLHGRGVVTHQSPQPGAVLEATAGRLELWLGNGAE